MEALLEIIQTNRGPWSLVVVFLGAALEYMVPPLPADSVLLASALLVVVGAYPFYVVAFVAVAGGFIGSLSHYGIGRVLSAEGGGMHGERWVERLTGRGSVRRFFDRFERYGVWVILLNRAFPGVRGVTFLAAGAARLPIGQTMFFGLLSNIAWTMLILALGVSVGGHWGKIEAALSVYSRVFYALGGAAVVSYAVYRIVKSRKR